jgi:low temperature requirement protein LtrA
MSSLDPTNLNTSAQASLAKHVVPTTTPPALSIRRRMSGRDIHQEHRASSPLEALFDLTTVVAVGAAASRLHHDIAAGHYVQAMIDLVFSFFTVWWSWMNFAWFSSAYDTDDISYRLATVVQMVGVLVMAVSMTLDTAGQLMGTLGYTIMRVALVGLWLRAAREHPERRATCCRYALGLTVLQGLWLLRALVLPTAWALPSFAVLVALELAVPAWGERAGETPWHPHHIAERYALFTIILLGECMVAAANAMSGVLRPQDWSADFIVVSFSIVGLIVGLWWTYFLVPFAQVLHLRRERAFLWGYGHAPVFIALAALNGVLELVADVLKGGASHTVGIAHEGTSPLLAIALSAAAVMVFLAALWWLGGQTTRRAERTPWLLLPPLLLACTAVAVVAYGLPLPWGLLLLTFAPATLIAVVMHRRHLQPDRFAVR